MRCSSVGESVGSDAKRDGQLVWIGFGVLGMSLQSSNVLAHLSRLHRVLDWFVGCGVSWLASGLSVAWRLRPCVSAFSLCFCRQNGDFVTSLLCVLLCKNQNVKNTIGKHTINQNRLF